MRSESEMLAAGRRASLQAVPAPPPLTELQQRADKLTTRRRLLGSSLAAIALVAVSVPVALNARSSTTVQNVAAGTGQVAPAAQVDSPPAQDEDGEDPVGQGPTEDGATEDTVHIQISGDDASFSIRVLTGDAAAAAADAAQSAADETLDIDGMTVWVSGTGDERTVAALVEPDVFVEVTGSADELDKLIDMLRTGEGRHNFSFGGPGGEKWEDFFDENFDPNDEDWFDHFDGEEFESFFDNGDFNFDDFEGFGDFNFKFDFDEDGFSGFGGDFEGFGDFGEFGDVESLDDLLKELEEHRGDFEQFFGDEGFGFPFAGFGEDFDGCISIESNTNGETSSFTFPDGCS